ncbi:MAG: hydrogenase maturation protease [Chloroflexi bacterium CFX2]|nr:hydrogenase maturation protease [Chloroflexi bacterium CFX2]
MKKVAVIGIGQGLRGDDAAGLEAVRRWQEKFPETANRLEVRFEACELPGLALIDLLNDFNAAILVDAVQSAGNPGSIHRLDESDLASFASGSRSAHGWGVAESLHIRNQLTDVEVYIRIIGIEAEQMELGALLSKSVEDAMPNLCDVIENEVHALL